MIQICRSWTPEGLCLFYEWIYAELGWKLPDHLLPVALGICDTRINKLMLIIGPGSGKALKVGTPVLTTDGWKPVETVKVGDQVMTPFGCSTTVRAVLPNSKNHLYKITFADGRQVVCNRKHLWRVYTKKFAKRGEPMAWRLRTTQELAAYMWHNRANRWYVPLTEPVPFPEAQLPIDPYVLGALLGDGHIGDNGFPIITSFDQEIIDRMQATGLDITPYAKDGRYGIRGLTKYIRELNLDGSRSWDKHIPHQYLFASIDQRIALLQGLFDTDGYVSELANINFCTTSPQLAKDVQQLIWSIGGIASITEKSTGYNKDDERVECRTAYMVNIRHSRPSELFHLKRKKERARATQYSDNLKLEIVAIAPAEEDESVCLNVAATHGLFLCKDYVVTHNSQMLSIVVPAWLLGHNPDMTILGISGGEALMQGFQEAVQDIIDKSPVWKQIFPNVRPDKVRGWSSTGGMYVTGKRPGIPDASYLAAGIDSKYLTGKHAKLLIVDDIHNEENSSTAEQCDKVVQKYAKTIVGRADPMGARFIMAGRRWHEDDIYGKLRYSDWVVMQLPAERPGVRHLYYDIWVPTDAEGRPISCVFTDRKYRKPTGELVRI